MGLLGLLPHELISFDRMLSGRKAIQHPFLLDWKGKSFHFCRNIFRFSDLMRERLQLKIKYDTLYKICFYKKL